MNGLTNFSSAVHFRGFPFKLRQFEFGCRIRIGNWNFKLQVKLVADLLIIVPTLSGPSCASFVAFDFEPIFILLFVDFYVLLDEIKQLREEDQGERECVCVSTRSKKKTRGNHRLGKASYTECNRETYRNESG